MVNKITYRYKIVDSKGRTLEKFRYELAARGKLSYYKKTQEEPRIEKI